MGRELPEDFTRLLTEAARHDPRATDAAVAAAYDLLRAAAGRLLRDERPGHLLSATALVHEAYARLFPGPSADPGRATGVPPSGDPPPAVGGRAPWRDRRHFFATAAEVMRCLLIDYARAERSQKRGGGRRRVDLDTAGIEDLIARGDPDQILAVTDAIEALERSHPVPGQVVRLKFYAGLSSQAAADAMGVSPETVKRKWAFARAYLAKALGDGGNAAATDARDG